jgi:hypothetical protein
MRRDRIFWPGSCRCAPTSRVGHRDLCHPPLPSAPHVGGTGLDRRSPRFGSLSPPSGHIPSEASRKMAPRRRPCAKWRRECGYLQDLPSATFPTGLRLNFSTRPAERDRLCNSVHSPDQLHRIQFTREVLRLAAPWRKRWIIQVDVRGNNFRRRCWRGRIAQRRRRSTGRNFALVQACDHARVIVPARDSPK